MRISHDIARPGSVATGSRSAAYPAFQRFVSEGRRKDDWEWQFELGLDCMLDGIAVRVREAANT
ncbi:hypothetical protein HDA40_001763 [Hamadaea flava]|uniref:TetR/AcrR family transcriptional regulator C-terminal domain-containing protein n=1 Tax=Hamadaea flava TaxID=1742688 RepID=A0ABV8LN26_9ACTN|nr:TetR/AcrR family transcriptional regulator C-terminal domain-containing protein [Hamadaea flava]MCP2323256.1 hypothetical protein [Hamadaea flava]